MTGLPIPDAALDDRLGIVGTAGSGKTYLALSLVERLLALSARVVLIDPLDVAWGLRMLENGKKSPFNIVILGGARGDLPINEHSGALIGETVAKSADSFVISLGSLGTKAGERRFMLAFLTALYRHLSGHRLHLIIDEADMFAPQQLRDKEGEAAKLLGQMETIVRRGRVKGFIPWLITQRPAVLNKDVLSQVDGLVALKLTSSQDRDAVSAWVEGQADKGVWKEIYASLATMQRGQGVVWIPGRGILKTASFPRKTTFDSSAAPKPGETRHAAELPALDLGALKDRLATVTKEIEENDPRRLKAKITELQAQQRKVPQGASPEQLSAARAEGQARGLEQGRAESSAEIHRLQSAIRRAGEALAIPLDTRAPAPARTMAIREVSTRPAVPPRPAPVTNGARDSSLGKADRLILTALAQYPQGRTKVQIALLAGYAVSGGGFNNAIGKLRSLGYAEGRGDTLTATSEGISALGSYDPLPVGDALLAHWYGQLGKAERAILETVASAYPARLDKEDVAAKAGYEVSGGGFNNALGRLRTLELIERGNPIRASDDLFG